MHMKWNYNTERPYVKKCQIELWTLINRDSYAPIARNGLYIKGLAEFVTRGRAPKTLMNWIDILLLWFGMYQRFFSIFIAKILKHMQ